MGEEKSLTNILTKIRSNNRASESRGEACFHYAESSRLKRSLNASLLGSFFRGIALRARTDRAARAEGKACFHYAESRRRKTNVTSEPKSETKIYIKFRNFSRKNASFCLKKWSRSKKVLSALFSQTLLETLLQTLLQTLLVTLNFTFFRKTCKKFSKRLKFVNRKK